MHVLLAALRGSRHHRRDPEPTYRHDLGAGGGGGGLGGGGGGGGGLGGGGWQGQMRQVPSPVFSPLAGHCGLVEHLNVIPEAIAAHCVS